MTRPLSLWNDSGSRHAIETFVRRVTATGTRDFVTRGERIAVFDNDGTLWCEKPMPFELGFILERLAVQADADPSLRDRQPWKSACDKDYSWIGDLITKHYNGDDGDAHVLISGILAAFHGLSVESVQRDADSYLRKGQNATLKRKLLECIYAPMVELLRYLDAHGFTSFIVSGGDRDFMRSVTAETYGIPADRVIGSSTALGYVANDDGGVVAYVGRPEVFDDGPAKPVRIWGRIGRRPILAVGNSNGDIQMLRYAGGPVGPALRLMLRHDDEAREFRYTAGAEKALELARDKGWTVVSMKNDWKSVFPEIW